MVNPEKVRTQRLPPLASGDLLLLIALDVQSRGFTTPLAAESLPRQVKNWPRWSWPVSAALLRYVARRLPPDPTPLPLAELWQSEFPLPLRPLLVAVTALALSHYNFLAPVLKLQRQAALLVQIQTIQAVLADWLQDLNGPAGRHLRNTLNTYELPRLLDTLVQHTGYFI
jgi:hypothetical protein